jgi:maleate isomerase
MYGYRARIGYTSPPAATEVFPYEFYKIVPEGVTLVLNTLPLVDRNSDEVDRAYEVSMSAAYAMQRAGADLFCFGGLPINVSRGFANAEDLARETEKALGIPVITSFSAQKDAFEKTRANKVGCIQPYDLSHTERFEGYVRELGGEPVGCAPVNAVFVTLGKVDEEQILNIGRELCQSHPELDTIYIPCPHFATAGVIEPLEQEFGVTVITALQAIVWRSLRGVGIDDKIDAFGKLFREH